VRVVEDPAAAVHLSLGHAGPTAAGTWSLRLAPGSGKPVLGPFLGRRGHPLLLGLDFTGVLWTAPIPRTDLDADTTALLEAGDQVLLSEQRRGRDRDLTLHLDLAGSGLTGHPAWPALIANLVAARRAALPGIAQPNLLTGQDLLVALPPGHRSLTLVDPTGHQARLSADAEGQVLIPGLDQLGEHRLVLDEVGTWTRVMVLPGDARMADLGAGATAVREATGDDGALVERQRSMVSHLLPILLTALAAITGWCAFTREEGRAP
jgi:hypothetical protein